MVSFATFQALALAFDGAEELPHFEKTSFRVKKKIFATYNAKANRACLKFNEIDQSVFCTIDASMIYPVPNKFGKQGWTLIRLDLVPTALFTDALTTAYCNVAPKKLAEKYQQQQ